MPVSLDDLLAASPYLRDLNGRHGDWPPLLMSDANGGERVGGDKRKYLKTNK